VTVGRDREQVAFESELYAELRPLMFSIAYRMLGSVSEADDVVQEAFLRFHQALMRETSIETPRSYLATITTRTSIDHLRRARARREEYVGEWLPEPVLEDPLPNAEEEHEGTADSLSLAFLVLLETLSPVQRAVFLLHDVFDYGYREIATIVGKSEQNCRQLAARARRQIDERRPRFETSREQRDELARRFFEAIDHGDTDGLVALLAADAAIYGDGGGKAPSWPRPIFGQRQVAELLATIGGRIRLLGIRRRSVYVNGQPGAVFLDPDGGVINVMSLDIAEGVVQTVRSVVNPEKLGHLGEVGDLGALLRAQHAGQADED
jgi:RNA polymerase sigma-70 factor (ECF subfamily)